MSTSASSVPGAGAPIANNNNDNSGRRLSVSPPPPSLERKFELLEARFTQPLGLFGNANSLINNSNNASFSSPQERGNNSNNSSNNNNNNNINNTACTNENSNVSQHSFSFSGGSNSNSNLMQQPMMTIRSKRNSRSMTSLDIVSRAAAKHMRKVAANSPIADAGVGLPSTTTTANTNTTSNFSFSSHSGNNSDPMNSNSNSNSQQTVVTGNRTTGAQPLPQLQEQALSQQSQPPQMERVVAESPPVLISPAKASSITKPKVTRALQICNSQPPSSTSSSSVGFLSFSILHGYCNPTAIAAGSLCHVFFVFY